jgi:hypothetical protein
VNKSLLPTLLGCIVSLLIGISFKFRLLSFLKHDVLLIGGKIVETEKHAEFTATLFFLFAALLLLLAIAIFLINRYKRNANGG